ncbi:MAG: hypothetical protein QOC95_35 [Thermoleophilaceae bacterium]|nr:hypothetical protein [Thermoleophilaceae bacterium]
MTPAATAADTAAATPSITPLELMDPRSEGQLLGHAFEATAVSDGELMELVATGDHAAFSALYARHSAAAHRLALRIVRTRDRADDVVQESFLALWTRSDQYREERGSLRGYVLTVVQHRAIDAVRRDTTHLKRRSSDLKAMERHEAPERTDTEAERHEEAATVQRALATLSGPQAHVIELAYFAGLSQSQIAERIQEPVGTVKGRVRLALVKLRQEIPPALPI